VTAAVEAFAGIALGVFVGEGRTLRLQDGAGGVVFRGDEVDGLLLPHVLSGDGVINSGVIKTESGHFSPFLAAQAVLDGAAQDTRHYSKRQGGGGRGGFYDNSNNIRYGIITPLAVLNLGNGSNIVNTLN
jgi:hypothetical protein